MPLGLVQLKKILVVVDTKLLMIIQRFAFSWLFPLKIDLDALPTNAVLLILDFNHLSSANIHIINFIMFVRNPN